MRWARTSRLFAAAVFTVAASGAVIVAAPVASAAPTHVAIVVSESGGVDIEKCLPAGGSGDTILNDTTSVDYRARDGIITRIDNYPASTVATDNTHFWAYFHNTGSGWSYSNLGAGSYTPAAGTVEGWRYDDGQSSGNAPRPPSVSYASICAGYDVTVAPAPPAPVTVPKTTTAAAVPTHAATSAAGSSATHSSAALTSTAASTTTVAGSTAASGAPSSSGSSSGSSGAIDGTSVTSSHASSVSKAVPEKSSSSGSIIAVIIGGVLVVALAAGSIVVAQRRRAS